MGGDPRKRQERPNQELDDDATQQHEPINGQEIIEREGI
jgi:hypothetical protein